MKFFNIFLISAYFLCGYAEIRNYIYVQNGKGIIFANSKNHCSAKTEFFTAKLKKHLPNVQHIDRCEEEKNNYKHLIFGRTLLTLHDIPTENIFKIPLASHLNKAPPYFL